MDAYNAQELANAQAMVQQLQAQYNAEYAQGHPNQTNTWNALQQWVTYAQMLQNTANQVYAR